MYAEEIAAGQPVRRKRKSPAGVATNDLVLSAHLGTNDEIFPQILKLYVPPGSLVVDPTVGHGVFWKQVPRGVYRRRFSDLREGVDGRDLPFRDGEVDALVIDPPYMHGGGGGTHEGHQHFEDYYQNNVRTNEITTDWHAAVVQLYVELAREAHRVMRAGGIFIVKCMDEVYAGKQRLTHIELLAAFGKLGFVIEDLFVLVRLGRPGVSRMLRQRHARHNHSYFIVMRKAGARR